jgi:PBP1b-binding outer membrane lipoprotein LpoB
MAILNKNTRPLFVASFICIIGLILCGCVDQNDQTATPNPTISPTPGVSTKTIDRVDLTLSAPTVDESASYHWKIERPGMYKPIELVGPSINAEFPVDKTYAVTLTVKSNGGTREYHYNVVGGVLHEA